MSKGRKEHIKDPGRKNADQKKGTKKDYIKKTPMKRRANLKKKDKRLV